MDDGEHDRHKVYLGGRVLPGVPGERYLQLFQLAENEEKAGRLILTAATSEDKKYPSEEPKGKIKAGDGVFAATLEDKKIPTLPKCVKSGFFVSW